MPEHVVQALAGWAFFKGLNSFAVSVLLGFYSMLRTGGLCALRSSHMVGSLRDKQILISLGFTKGGKRQGAAESTILGFEPVVLLTQQWKSIAQPSTGFCKNSAQWRQLFAEGIEAIGVSSFGFRPYCTERRSDFLVF